jgi:hypothetical protein
MQTKLVSCIALALLAAPVVSSAVDFSGNVSLEGRYFPDDPAFDGQQENGGISISFEPELKHTWDNDKQQITFTPFYRWDDQDEERSHGDIRQLDYLYSSGDWEYQVGVSKKFWGVTESSHLVDIINQTDSVEGTDGEDKLGQPLIRATRLLENGALDFYVLPYFRERTFTGKKGRFRSGLVVDAGAAEYESSDDENHIDYALRWTTSVDEFDVGLSYFGGTSREPTFDGRTTANGDLIPFYEQIQQYGLDLQYTGESTIWKLETIHRRSKADDFTAAVGGFEHSLEAYESGAEMSLLAEYHNDSRGESLSSPFQNDLFVAARYAFNDEASSELLAGAFYDLDNDTTSIRLEGSRRIGEGMKLNVEAQVVTNADEDDPLNNFAEDDYVQIELQKFF